MGIGRRAAGFLHRHLWHNLPPGLRRAGLLKATSLLAPRPDPAAVAAEPIFVVGALRTASGLGQSARLCCAALRRLGFDARGIDTSASQMQPLDLTGDASAPSGDRRHRGPGTVILHVNAPLVPLALTVLGKGFVRGKRIVGYWAWELPEAPDDWQTGAPLVHEIWVPSRFTADAMAGIAGQRPVRIVPHPMPASPGYRRPRPDQPFRVLTIFNCASGFERKNPCAAIHAFRQAFPDRADAELVLKSSNLAVYPQASAALADAMAGQPNIRHLEGTAAPERLEELYAGADAVVSLHRSEGFGLVPAEAMLRGLPVVATGWSGNMDFMHAENSCPVRFSLIPAIDPQRTYHHPDQSWADPDVAHAADCLRRLKADRSLRLRLGEQAQRTASELFSLEAFGARVSAALRLKPSTAAAIQPQRQNGVL